MMQVRKTYHQVNPQLLYDEVKDFVLKQGTTLGESRLETYLVPDDSSTFIFRGTLTFRVQQEANKAPEECLRAHVVGIARGETKLMLDINDELFPQEKVTALQDDLDFIFRSYEPQEEDI
jgi:hypothetical protein